MAAIDPQILTPTAHALSLNLSSNDTDGQTPTRPPSQHSALNDPAQPPPHPKAKGKTCGTDDVDLLAHARHPSQLPAVFTTGYAQKEHLRQQKDTCEAEQREINQRAASTIQVFGWAKV